MARWAPARADVIGEFANEVLQTFAQGRILVGIDGRGGAGKTTFATDLSGAIRETGTDSAAVSLDAFHTERSVRHQEPADSRVWYEHAYDYATFRRTVIEPYRRGEPVALEFRSREDDSVIEHPRTWTPAERAVLVVEGCWLLRRELVGLWHTSAWLAVDRDVAIARWAERDGFDPNPEAPINRLFADADDRYVAEVDPRKRANANIDMADPAHPRRTFADSC